MDLATFIKLSLVIDPNAGKNPKDIKKTEADILYVVPYGWDRKDKIPVLNREAARWQLERLYKAE